MRAVLTTILLFSLLLLFPDDSASLPLCTDSRAPVIPKSPLAFCPYKGSVCCDSVEDIQLQKRFQSMNISDPTCASLLKSILCVKCDPFSAELFKIESGPRTVPVLCNSTISVKKPSHLDNALNGFCAKVWDTCQNVSLLNSPFSPSFQGGVGLAVNSISSKLADLWPSKGDFCNAFGGASGDGSVCFDGVPVSPQNSEIPSPPNGLCLEKIENGSYINMVAHPDGSNRIFLSNQAGKIWLATVPEEGSSATLGLNESNPFLDLTDKVHYSPEFGMMGMAFHPNFAFNGRFFVSFSCDGIQWSECSGRCSCNSDVDCDPSKIGSINGAWPCQYSIVISEFTANGTTSHLSLVINPSEVRRILMMGLPCAYLNGGQILFGPTDGYLYIMMGDSGRGDPLNFAQNKKSLLGKILRLDIDNIASAMGNYSIHKDNPFAEDKELRPEIWALGLRDPWRCSFDSERPSYFICADSGEDQYEEVDIVTKGGNYGWRIYEGPFLFDSSESPGGNTSASSKNPIFPVMGYNHSPGSSAIIGGYLYRSMTDPCIYGRYLYADLYSGVIWAGTESPENSGNFTSHPISYSCAHDSPIKFSFVAGSPIPDLGYIFSFGEDNRKDVYILASSGVYRVTRPNHCNYKCSKEVIASTRPIPGPSATPSFSHQLRDPCNNLVLLFTSSMLLLLSFVL